MKNLDFDKDSFYTISKEEYTEYMYCYQRAKWNVEKISNNNNANGYIVQMLKYSDKKIILCVERPDKNIRDLKNRRKEFYLRNGLYTTNKFTEDIGVEYEVLCSDKEYVINEKVFKNLFTQMTNKLILRKLINKIYHIDYVGFIE